MATDTNLTGSSKSPRQRVPASERRDSLVEAAVHEFAQTGLHGTPVDRIARKVGVAQPYVFSLFGSKRDLFIAAVARGYERIGDRFADAAAAFDPATAPPDTDVLTAMGEAYSELLESDRDYLMLQLQSYAACSDEVIRVQVRKMYAQLMRLVQELAADLEPQRIDDFFRYGMWLNVAAAMGVEDLSLASDWVREGLTEAD